VAPEDGEHYEDLFKAADMALYRAKGEGRGAWRWFEPEMNERMQMRRTVEVDLRRALERNEFELRYQPIVETATRRIKSFEALVRWRHPERGLIAPDAFIPLCEEIGLIAPLGAWVLREACAEASHWPAPIGVAVNISPLQFIGHKLVETVESALESSGLAPQRLEVEITETAVLQNSEATLAILGDLKKLGVRIAMDDFGTGYSSLSSLQSFPFDKVKIDRSFTTGLDQSRQNDAIVTAMINLCEGLDICATAEGVETEGQLASLFRRGCLEAQGYLFSRPCPAEDVPALISRLGVCAEWPQAAE
jgi:EAL domain-containing protein (putative c-di-GMP-specific phosphodiesterase class I)